MLRQRSGNVLIIALISIVVMGVSLHAMIDYTLSQKRQTVRTDNVLDLKFALDSSVDFVLFGIRQKYCFSNTLMSDTNCNMTHDGSTERLIMSNEQLNFLIAAGKISVTQAATTRLAKISRDMEIAAVTSSHPLYQVLGKVQQLPGAADIKYLHVDIERDDSSFLPRSGNEVYINVRVSLNKGLNGTTTLTAGDKKLQILSRLVIYPREVGTFALLIPRDMHLGSSAAAPVFGDTHFYRASNKEQFTGSSGLLFMSPVFVNRNIILNPSGSYSPVTFAERVYMGSGNVLAGSSPFKPSSNGALGGRYWRDLDNFGGFLKGLENDGASDAGLNAFIGSTTGPAPSESLMSQCVDRNLSQTDLRKILTSNLTVQTAPDTGPGFEYLLKLTNSEFEGQGTARKVQTNNWGSGTTTLNYNGVYQKTVMDLTLKVGALNTTVSMSKDATMSVVVQVGSPQYESKLNGDLSAATAALNAALADPDNNNSTKIQTLKAAQQAATDKLDNYKTAVANPPRITIRTDPVAKKNGDSKNKLNFSIDIANGNHLIDGNGNLVNPEISIKAYDSSYMDGGFIGNRSDSWKNNGAKFQENNKLSQTLDFTIDANSAAVNAPTGVPPATTADYEDLGDQCMDARNAQESQAFGMADANVSFANSTRQSWNFAGTGSETSATKTDPLVNSLIFDGSNALAGANNTTFQVRSIVGTCTIKGTANFVTGFLPVTNWSLNKELVLYASSAPSSPAA